MTKEPRETAPPVSEGEVIPPAKPRTREDWQRPPFEPGNKLAVTHGAYSSAIIHQAIEEVWPDIQRQLEEMPGYMPADQLLGDELRETIGILIVLRRARQEKGPLDEQGNPRPFTEYENKVSRRMLELAKAMGLGTSERAKVFGQFMAAGRAAAEATAAQQRIRERLARPKARKRREAGK